MSVSEFKLVPASLLRDPKTAKLLNAVSHNLFEKLELTPKFLSQSVIKKGPQKVDMAIQTQDDDIQNDGIPVANIQARKRPASDTSIMVQQSSDKRIREDLPSPDVGNM